MIMVLFHSTHAVINAEKICHKNGLKVKVVPVPRHISSDCGMSLEIPKEHEETISRLLTEKEIEFEIHAS